MPVLEVVGENRILPTKATQGLIRKKAAQNGYVVSEIKTHADHVDAILKGLPDQVVDRLIKELEKE